jgi:hypothetical protein
MAVRLPICLAGKVLKDEETLATYKLQAGHTVHMVKVSLASRTRLSSRRSADATSLMLPGRAQDGGCFGLVVISRVGLWRSVRLAAAPADDGCWARPGPACRARGRSGPRHGRRNLVRLPSGYLGGSLHASRPPS